MSMKGTRKKAAPLRVVSVSRKPSMSSSTVTPLGGLVGRGWKRLPMGAAAWQASRPNDLSQLRQTARPAEGAISEAGIGRPQSGQWSSTAKAWDVPPWRQAPIGAQSSKSARSAYTLGYARKTAAWCSRMATISCSASMRLGFGTAEAGSARTPARLQAS